MKNDPIEGAMERLDGVDVHSAEGKQQLQKALEGKFALVAAKAARIAGDAIATELTGPLASAFARLIARGSDGDKGCVALTDIARALVNLDFDDADLFKRGMKHIQMEATYGGSVDVASELRAVCAMGLANSRDPKKLQAMAELLADPEWPARGGAARALGVVGSEAACLLLRYKALVGDPAPDVLTDCLSGLLSAEGGEALPLVGRIAESKDPENREAALLALGASRRPDAVEWLKARFENVADRDTKQSIVLALASSRTTVAMEFVLDLIRNESAHTAIMAVSAMSVYRNDPRLREEIVKAAESRSDGAAVLRGGRL
jgi:hypothetical protein